VELLAKLLTDTLPLQAYISVTIPVGIHFLHTHRHLKGTRIAVVYTWTFSWLLTSSTDNWIA